jgi:hypothetical protein
MAIARLLVAGVMVAGGLVLGAFAALGYLDPNWTQNQLAAASKREAASEPKSSINAFRRTRFVAVEAETPPRSKPLAVKPSSKQPQKAAESTPVERKHIVKTAARKKVADRPGKESEQPQQQAAVFQWPWKLFGN